MSRIPVIGGKQLDLHVLYIEVTRRGGFDKVVTEKRWSDVGSVFEFSPTTTSASYVLKKHYSNILRHYEQVYFFQKQGPLLSQTADSIGAASNGGNPSHEPEYPSQKSRVEPNPQATVNGNIVGKFDCGYLVVVKVGSEILHGVLYHSEQPSSSMPTVQPGNATVPHNDPKLYRRSGRKKRGSDPNRPKPNRSGYNFFFADKHSELKSLYPDREREFTKMIGESWNNLNPEKKEVYQKIGLKDKERYEREMKEYTERMKLELSEEDVKVGY